jgi:enamine deaminase RidA (YjgF/YER057c/UK114 family)
MTTVAILLNQEIWRLRCAMHMLTYGRCYHSQAAVDNIVDETLFVTDMNTTFAAAEKCREDVFFGTPIVASTIVHFQRLTFPRLMIGIKCIAKV